MTKSPKSRLWTTTVSLDLQMLLSDVEYAFIGAKLYGAARKKKSQATWRRAMRLFDILRRECSRKPPRRVRVRALARKAEEIFDRAKKLSRPREEPAPTARKVTVLDGYYASGDYESFVFDRCSTPRAHIERWRDRYGDPMQAQMSPNADEEVKACSVYTEALLPPRTGHRFGKWRVVVEFWPKKRSRPIPVKKPTEIRMSPRFEPKPPEVQALERRVQRRLQRAIDRKPKKRLVRSAESD